MEMKNDGNVPLHKIHVSEGFIDKDKDGNIPLHEIHAPLSEGFIKTLKEPPAITKEHVKAFTPVLTKGKPDVNLPEEQRVLIQAFKTLERNGGLRVMNTDTPEGLQQTLETLSPSESGKGLLTISGLFGTPIISIEVGKDAITGESVKVFLPKEKILELASELRTGGIGEAYHEINKLEEQVKKGMELYLEFPPAINLENLMYPGDPKRVSVSSDVFHWFMTNPTYTRQLSSTDTMMASINPLSYFNPFFNPFFLPNGTETEQRLIQGGYADPVHDGNPGEPAIRGKYWKEFSERLEALSRRVREDEERKEKAELGFHLFTDAT